MKPKVAIIGHGYIGQRIVSQLGDRASVVTFDLDPNRGDPIKSFLETETTGDYFDAVFLCLPTFAKLGGGADCEKLIQLTAASHDRSRLVVVCSTVDLEFAESVSPSTVFFPERVNPGVADSAVRVIGGDCFEHVEKAVDFISKHMTGIDRIDRASSAKVAILSKLVENAYRLVNIALVNELAGTEATSRHTHEAIGLASGKPFGYEPFFPSWGAGGHCIPEDPLFLTAGCEMPLVRQAAISNWSACQYFASKIEEFDPDKVLILGVAYKPNSDVTSNSGPLCLARLLSTTGIAVEVWDPHVQRSGWPSKGSAQEAIDDASFIVIGTWHEAFEEIRPVLRKAEMAGTIIFDPFFQYRHPTYWIQRDGKNVFPAVGRFRYNAVAKPTF